MGVCDGHGIFGQDISTYLVNNLPQNMNNEIQNKNIKNISTEKISKLSEIFESTFIQTNINLNTDERIDSTYSGSTCASVLFTPTRLICINVGDSRCVMGKLINNRWSSKNLTRDHKPSDPNEKDRIIAYGGKVEQYMDNLGNYVGPERVWLKEGNAPGLAMSRSFGDEVAHTIGVIINPEINEYQLLCEDKFIILASDGIWEFISSEEAVNIIKPFYIDNDIEGGITRLYKEASKRWIMEEEVIDDITVILVFLN
jgi:serine/threonine protein phosphatase PrpC